MNVDAYWRGWLAPLPVSKLPKEQDFQPNNVVTMREAHILAANHKVVQELESLYSWRKKDPRLSSSRLTRCESDRFQAALYRVWFVCALYGRPAPANRVGKSKSKRLREIQRDVNREQAKFLQSFTPSQMTPLLEVWKFMVDLATWAVRAEFFPRKNCSSLEAYLVWCGPRTTLQAFRGNLTSVDRKVVPALRASYEQFCEVFNMAESLKRPGDGVLILPYECILSKLKCQQCARAPLEGLWSESNWSYLRGVVPPSEFFKFVELPWWNSYTDADVLGDICRSTPYSQLIGEVFLLRSKAYRTWKPGYWLCTTCLQTFMRDNIDAFCRSREYPEQ
ncbi:hypothetical protein L210DRAFT_3535426 [Boletus edulis BED1]|uniref:Uncharacterized protein n=1 Tax=Boletus edulis BED1 TaxID=1328754 RepID=A0AAD4GGT4_BOLED|nr:hypothetical protein L210DRAFT_3535426 [Boletus edulis BED1]